MWANSQWFLGIGMSVIHSILHDYLWVKKLCERWAPINLSDDEKKTLILWFRASHLMPIEKRSDRADSSSYALETKWAHWFRLNLLTRHQLNQHTNAFNNSNSLWDFFSTLMNTSQTSLRSLMSLRFWTNTDRINEWSSSGQPRGRSGAPEFKYTRRKIIQVIFINFRTKYLFVMY